MCGICGYRSPEMVRDEGIVRAMTETLAHRGPDGSGVFLDRAAGLAFGHRRLSVLELSSLGQQPMLSACGRYCITYNGEIYNHLELRKELIGYPFKSSSDTETILTAIAAWGVKAALKRFVGMFAFALWDNETNKLFLVRDRMGIKPLYYGKIDGGGWVFGSEMKALRAHPAYSSSIDRNSLALYFRHGYIPAPYSICQGTWKVEPGQMIVLGNGELHREKWWDINEVWQSGFENPWEMDDAEAVDSLGSLLSDAVKVRMLSDVPLGAFLSGGIDSSTVVALMQEHSFLPVKTFSIGFHEAAYNEAQHAKVVADHLGTDHTELYVTPKDLLDVVPSIPKYWDEPFADSSQIPTYVLSKLTREHVTVSLSGDGGDELFSGYQRYFYAHKWNRIASIPLPVRNCIKHVLKAAPAVFFKAFGAIGPKIRWRLDLLSIEEFQEFYLYLLSHFKNPTQFVFGSEEMPTPLTDTRTLLSDQYAHMALRDLQMYLPDDILTKVDKASMSASLEARVPLIDHRVVEFAARTPTSAKVRNGDGKWLLKQVLYRYVPQAIIDRPKMGFGVPVEQWMRNELREWCEDLLSSETIRRQGYIDADKVGRMWREYLDGENNWNYYLWDVLMFQSWLAEWEQ